MKKSCWIGGIQQPVVDQVVVEESEPLTPAQVEAPGAKGVVTDSRHGGPGGSEVTPFQEDEAGIGGAIGDSDLALIGEGAGTASTERLAAWCGTTRSREIAPANASADVGTPTAQRTILVFDFEIVVSVRHHSQNALKQTGTVAIAR